MVAAIVMLLMGLGMVFFNGPLARRLQGYRRAKAKLVPVEWIRRWLFWPYYKKKEDEEWLVPFRRAGLVFMGLLWTTVWTVVVVLIALGVK
jgi:hypothetical protein